MSDAVLEELLAEARELGFLGGGAVEAGIEHARGFAAGVAAPARLVDLGSGGGLPGLVLALLWNDTSVALIEASVRRSRFLTEAVDKLGISGRVQVVAARAEVVGRQTDFRGQHGVVVARSFGPPPVTAECAAPLLRVGGRLVVSEPPDAGDVEARWPTGPLAELGLIRGPAWTTRFHYQSLEQVEPCPERFPRRVGVPAKRPLY